MSPRLNRVKFLPKTVLNSSSMQGVFRIPQTGGSYGRLVQRGPCRGKPAFVLAPMALSVVTDRP